jgi:hypothetical protein
MTKSEAMRAAIDVICREIHWRLAHELRRMLDEGATIEQCLAHLEKRRDDVNRFGKVAMPRLRCAIVHGASLQ